MYESKIDPKEAASWGELEKVIVRETTLKKFVIAYGPQYKVIPDRETAKAEFATVFSIYILDLVNDGGLPDSVTAIPAEMAKTKIPGHPDIVCWVDDRKSLIIAGDFTEADMASCLQTFTSQKIETQVLH